MVSRNWAPWWRLLPFLHVLYMTSVKLLFQHMEPLSCDLRKQFKSFSFLFFFWGQQAQHEMKQNETWKLLHFLSQFSAYMQCQCLLISQLDLLTAKATGLISGKYCDFFAPSSVLLYWCIDDLTYCSLRNSRPTFSVLGMLFCLHLGSTKTLLSP